MKAITSLILVIMALIALGVELQATQQDLNSKSAMSLVYSSSPLSPTGFPSDFPAMQDLGGPGAGEKLTGFGGDHSKTKADNRAAVKHIPVILLHGNGAYAEHPFWGMQTIKRFLKEAGYNDSEIWAVSYLGSTNSTVYMDDPHKNNIGEVRAFIDGVIDYLGVDKVVLIGHSLGAGMSRCYLLGLDHDGSFNPALTRFNRVKGLITISGGNYGLGPQRGLQPLGEFETGCQFEKNTHHVTGTEVWDDTPYGAKATSPDNHQAMTMLPNGRNYNNNRTFGYSGTSLDQVVNDNDSRRIFYAGLTSIGDLADAQELNTGYLQGADINQGWNADVPLDWLVLLNRHAWIIKNKSVFEQGIVPILEKCNKTGATGEITVPVENK